MTAAANVNQWNSQVLSGNKTDQQSYIRMCNGNQLVLLIRHSRISENLFQAMNEKIVGEICV